MLRLLSHQLRTQHSELVVRLTVSGVAMRRGYATLAEVVGWWVRLG